MTTAQCLAELAPLPAATRLEALDGMLWGQSVDPIWPDSDMALVKIERARALREMGRK